MKTEGRSDQLKHTVQKFSRIPMSALDPNRYTETLMAAAYEAGVYDDAAVTAIRGELFDLLAVRLEKLTNGESCSVSAETAQAVLSAVLYTLDMRLLAEPDPDSAADLLAQTAAAALYDEGIHRIKRRLQAAGLQYHRHLSMFLGLPDSVMKTTAVHAIGGALRTYRPEGLSDAQPITADYPLYLDMNEIMGQRGVTFLCQYLQGLADEAHFLSKFRADTLHAVLSAGDPQYSHTPSNLFSPMLATAVGMVMRKHPFSAWKYGLQGEDIEALAQMYDSGAMTKDSVTQAAEIVIDLLMLEGTCAAYVRRAVQKLYDSIADVMHRGLPMLVFPCTDAAYRNAVRREASVSDFENFGLRLSLFGADGIAYRGGRMDAESFRQLDFDLRQCAAKEAQVEMILSRVRGLEDICDLLTADTGVLDGDARAYLLSVLPREVRLYLSEMVGEDLTV